MTDITEDARRVQVGVHRRMSGAERLRLALEMSEFARPLAMARLRREHPEWADAAIAKEVLRHAFIGLEWEEVRRQAGFNS